MRHAMIKISRAVFLFLFSVQLLSADPLRQTLNINRDWKFRLGDFPGAEAPKYDDASWDAIGLPHSFSTPYFQGKDFYVGYGWYRKHLDIKPEWIAKRVFVEFAGAFQDAQVFINGQLIGEHKGGYTGFSMDITSAIHSGDNVLAVRLNNNWNAQIEPRAGDFNFIGGIYRDVNLVVTDPLHVTWYGTFVTTPDVFTNAGTVNVNTEIQNQSAVAKNCAVTTDILDPDGKPVAHFSSTQKVEAGATLIFDQTSPAIAAPRLWHPAHPFLYTALTKVFDGAKPVDDFKTTFGIRSIKWTADQGFFINGGHFYFHGADVHQDHAGWADAVTEYGSYRDVKLIKDAGLDFIRGSHYPHQPAFADACDQLGVLFWSENCFWGLGGAHKEGDWTANAYPTQPGDEAAFEQNSLDTLRDEIRIFRNHPSIVAWSMCNEVFFSTNLPKVRGLLTKLVSLTHELDPTRPAAIGGAQRGGVDKLGDVAGYNGDGSRLFINPGIPNAVTEYGSVSSYRPGNYDGQFKPSDKMNFDTPEYPWRSGQVVWCGFDYGTIVGPAAGSKGLVDYFRIPKRSWYWYRNEYAHIPPPEWPQLGTPAKLALSADKNVIHGTDATDDAQILVTVQDANGKPLNNSPPVTFAIESGPGEFPTGRSITFDPQSDIVIRDGEAAIEFRSYFGGKSVIRATSPGLQDATITITTEGEPVFVAGKTPVVADRPYTRYVKPGVSASDNQNVALNRPTSASSEAPGHTAAAAVDGNAATYWSASDPKPGAWIQVDLEHPYNLASIETTFTDALAYQYKIEGSPDGVTWTLLADQTQTAFTDKIRTDTCAKNDHCQFVRMTFTGLPPGRAAAVAEMKMSGNYSP
jgi:hypothetical protein